MGAYTPPIRILQIASHQTEFCCVEYTIFCFKVTIWSSVNLKKQTSCTLHVISFGLYSSLIRNVATLSVIESCRSGKQHILSVTLSEWVPLFCRFTSCLSFYAVLNELNDYAGQREVVAEEMGHRVYGELMRYSQDLKAERKHVSTVHTLGPLCERDRHRS